MPGGKSETQRAFLLAALLPGTRTVCGASTSDDARGMARALRQLGATIEESPGGSTLTIEGLGIRKQETGPGLNDAPGGNQSTPLCLDLGENGTAARTLAMVLPMLGLNVAITGHARLHARPMGAAVDALREAGCRVSASNLPLTIESRDAAWAQDMQVNAAETTQAASGALLGQAVRLARGDSAASALGITAWEPRATAYLELTAASLREFGFDVQAKVEQVNGRRAWRATVACGELAGWRIDVPVDASASVFPRVLAAMHGLPAWNPAGAGRDAQVLHADDGVVADLATLSRRGDVTLDGLGARPDAFPGVAVAAACRVGTTRIIEVPALRIKETDRIAAMVRGLRAAGATCEELAEGVVMSAPVPRNVGDRALELATAPDHRVVMALALLGTWIERGVVVEHAECVAKSWPGYFDWLAAVAQVD